jgi:hypothetical protein
MDATVRSDTLTADTLSAISWGSIAGGAVAAAALTLALLALGVGLGLSSISPWEGSGLSASTFKTTAGVYLVLVAVISSAIGGYLAGRLRTKWTDLQSDEVFFRDTAHGFISWAFATVLSASALAAATTHIVSGAAAGIGAGTGAAAQAADPSRVYVDKLFRPNAAGPAATSPSSGAAAGAPGGNPNVASAEVYRLWTADFRADNDLSPADKAYVVNLVAARTGMSQPEAEKRVNDVITEAKAAADNARRGTTKLAFWMTAALIFGAFAASLAAVEGGQLRDGSWTTRGFVKRPWR